MGVKISKPKKIRSKGADQIRANPTTKAHRVESKVEPVDEKIRESKVVKARDSKIDSKTIDSKVDGNIDSKIDERPVQTQISKDIGDEVGRSQEKDSLNNSYYAIYNMYLCIKRFITSKDENSTVTVYLLEDKEYTDIGDTVNITVPIDRCTLGAVESYEGDEETDLKMVDIDEDKLMDIDYITRVSLRCRLNDGYPLYVAIYQSTLIDSDKNNLSVIFHLDV